MSESIEAATVNLWGGRLCLDFTNTVEWHAGDSPINLLETYEDLVTWAEHAELISQKESALLLEKAGVEKSDAERVLENTIELREALYRVFVSVAEKREPEGQDMEVFNQNLGRAMSKARMKIDKGSFALDLSGDRDSLDWFIRPIIWSAAQTLHSGELHRLKQCADESCGWLFWDTSRNHSRRWCSMEDCGNRAKAKRFYRKKKKS